VSADPPREPRATIRDVARESGVALSTVSNALQGRPHVSEATRRLVQEVAERLGYRPSTMARALRMQRSFSIGVLMADIANPTFPEILRGIEDVLSADQCALFLSNTDGSLQRQVLYMHHMLDRQVDGFVLVSQHVDDPAVQALLDGGPPAVLVHRRSQLREADYVGLDNADSMRQAVGYLAGLGHRRIGFIRGPDLSTTAEERRLGFIAAMTERGQPCRDDWIVPGGYSYEAGLSAGRLLLGLAQRPSAVIASNDIAAIGMIAAATEQGIAIPHELSVVGIDDIYLAALPPIGLTTIRQPKRQVGAAAAELLLQRIQVPEAARPPQQRIFPTELIVRNTTAPAPALAGAAG